MSNAILYRSFSKQGRASVDFSNSADDTGVPLATAGRLGLLALLLLALLLPAGFCAAASQQIQASWSYSGSAVDLAGFRLYKDAALVCSSNDPAARTMTCNVDLGSTPALFSMTAFDIYGVESAKSTAFTLTPSVPNQAPISVAQANVLTGPAPLAVFFDGGSSSDPDGYVAGYSWNLGDGASGTGVAIDHTYTLPGIYTAILTVTDDSGTTAQSSVAINVGEVVVPNQPPAALLIASNGNGVAPMAVTFDGSRSSDADGTIASYSWNFGDGGLASGALVNHSFATAGSYTVTLTVTDNQGATAQSHTVITVDAPPNKAPSAVVTSSVLSGTVPLVVSFNGSGSSDTDGTIASFAWNFGDGSTGSGATSAHTFSAAGSYTVTLTVTDNQGATGQAQKVITVQPPPNQAPAAVLTSNVSSGTAPLAVSFSGSGSSDSDGTIASYAWTFGDGSNGSGATVSHSFSAAGSYTVILKVTDNKGATAQTQKVITVQAPPVTNKPPIAMLKASVKAGKAPLLVRFKSGGSIDPDGKIVSYAWSFGDGATASGASVSHTFKVAGQFTVTLTVTDNKGAAVRATTQIAVSAGTTKTSTKRR